MIHRLDHLATVIEVEASSELGWEDAVKRGFAETQRLVGATGNPKIEVIDWIMDRGDHPENRYKTVMRMRITEESR